MKKFVLDAYHKNPTLITVVKIHENGAVHGDDSRGVRIYATKDRVLPIPLPSEGKL